MTINRRDLLKSAAIAALPGSFLLGATPLRGEADSGSDLDGEPGSPPEVSVPDDFHPTSRFVYLLDPGQTLIFPCGYSKIVVKSYLKTLKIFKNGIFFKLNVPEMKSYEFGGAVNLTPSISNPIPKGNMLHVLGHTKLLKQHRIRNHYDPNEWGQWQISMTEPFWENDGQHKSGWLVEAVKEEKYTELFNKCRNKTYHVHYGEGGAFNLAQANWLPGKTEFIHGSFRKESHVS